MKAKGGRRRQAAALQGASRIFMHGGELEDHEICAENDSSEAFFRSLLVSETAMDITGPRMPMLNPTARILRRQL